MTLLLDDHRQDELDAALRQVVLLGDLPIVLHQSVILTLGARAEALVRRRDRPFLREVRDDLRVGKAASLRHVHEPHRHARRHNTSELAEAVRGAPGGRHELDGDEDGGDEGRGGTCRVQQQGDGTKEGRGGAGGGREEEERRRMEAAEGGMQTASSAEIHGEEEGEEQRNQHAQGVTGACTLPEECE